MGLGTVKTVAKGCADVVVTFVVVLALAWAVGVGTGVVNSAAGLSNPWTVTVGNPSRTLYPGTDAVVPYTVVNTATTAQTLHSTGVQFKTDGVGIFDTFAHRYVDECKVEWFRVGADAAPTGAAVAPGGSAHGSVVIALDDRPGSQYACLDLAVEVDVTAD